jgi:hypothetical protein
MTPEQLRWSFRDIGASLIVAGWQTEGRPEFRIRVERTDRRERFVLTGRAVSVDVPDADAALRQLLLVARWDDPARGPITSRALCGFDERHWFTASVPDPPAGDVATVAAAHEALKPEAARLSQEALRVPPPLRNARRNAGFVRQGEWFFIPLPHLKIDLREAQRNVPLQRWGGTPHVVQYLAGGPSTWGRGWSRASDKPVYARGRIRHRDHATVTLPFWHFVELSEEPGIWTGGD